MLVEFFTCTGQWGTAAGGTGESPTLVVLPFQLGGAGGRQGEQKHVR